MLNLFWTDSGKNCLDLEWMINTPEGNLEEISQLVKDLPKMTARHSQILKRYEPPTELPMQKTPPAKPCIKDSLRPCLKVKQCIKMGPGKLASRCLKWHVAKCQDLAGWSCDHGWKDNDLSLQHGSKCQGPMKGLQETTIHQWDIHYAKCFAARGSKSELELGITLKETVEMYWSAQDKRNLMALLQNALE